MPPPPDALTAEAQFTLVGGGIASLAAAALLIRDGGISGSRIQIFEQLNRVGGSLDGQGSPESGVSQRRSGEACGAGFTRISSSIR
jgi:oleate hydratase